MRRSLALIILILIVLNSVGCERQNVGSNITESSIITLYFGGKDGYLVEETREVFDLTPQRAIEELIKGPNNDNYFKTLPDKTELIDVKVEDRIAYVNFDKSLDEKVTGAYGTSCGSGLLLYSIVNTLVLHESFNIDKVQIVLDGEKIMNLGPFAMEFPFEANKDMIAD